jgi:hypothetical protein
MRSRDRKASFGLASVLLLMVPAVVQCGGSGSTDSPSGGGSTTVGGESNSDAGAGDKPNQNDGGMATGGGGPGGECADGFADCDENPKTGENGCEADLSKPENCGECGNACAIDNASASCKAGKCTVLNCDTGFGDCDSLASNGCETKLDELANCGECGKKCTGSQMCQGGVCSSIKCDEGEANCDNDATNGCEPLNTLEDCEFCGTPCALNNATETCDAGSCEIMACDDGFGNCDKKVATGCEAPLNTEGNCGECGKPCAIDNAEVSCDTGTCEFLGCLDGFADCNTNLADGCEVAINTLDDCGACDATCQYTNAKTLCEKNAESGKFQCNFTNCDSGWEDVNQSLLDGCECQDAPSPAVKTCLTAKSLGTLGNGSSFSVDGTIPLPTESDWFTVNLNPADRPVVNTSGITIKFAANTSSEFRFDLATACNVTAMDCTGTEKGKATGLTSWEFKDVCASQPTCILSQMKFVPGAGNGAVVALPSSLYIRVYRNGGALSCNQYTLQVLRN